MTITATENSGDNAEEDVPNYPEIRSFTTDETDTDDGREQIGGNITNCAGFWLNAGWEQRTESKAISRWFVAWKDTGNNEIAGAVAGYCGGGSFLVERFYAQLEGENLNSLWIDYEDRISGNEINFSELDEKILSSCEDALDCIWEWNNHDHWGETDEVVLLNDKKHQLSAKADMLYFSTEKVPYLHMICEKAGLTAAPA